MVLTSQRAGAAARAQGDRHRDYTPKCAPDKARTAATFSAVAARAAPPPPRRCAATAPRCRRRSAVGLRSAPGLHCPRPPPCRPGRSEEHTSELQSRGHLVCRPLLEKKTTD